MMKVLVLVILAISTAQSAPADETNLDALNDRVMNLIESAGYSGGMGEEEESKLGESLMAELNMEKEKVCIRE